MIKKILRIILFCLPVGFSSCFPIIVSAYQNLQGVDVLQGGLQEKPLAVCLKILQKQCRITIPSMQNADCLIKAFASDKNCEQSQAIFQKTQGVIQRWRNFNNITVAYLNVIAADHSDDYDMITKQGQLIGLFSAPLITAYPAAASSPDNTDLDIWPMALGDPKAVPLPNGNNQIIFKQLLTKTCLACSPRGSVTMAYLFDPEGHYLKWQVMGFKLEQAGK